MCYRGATGDVDTMFGRHRQTREKLALQRSINIAIDTTLRRRAHVPVVAGPLPTDGISTGGTGLSGIASGGTGADSTGASGTGTWPPDRTPPAHS